MIKKIQCAFGMGLGTLHQLGEEDMVPLYGGFITARDCAYVTIKIVVLPDTKTTHHWFGPDCPPSLWALYDIWSNRAP